jgi:predicted transcriptional regulator
MSDKMTAKERTQMLKSLKKQHAETAARAQEYLKTQQKVRRELKKAMKPGPMTIPQIAKTVDMPKDVVLWHVVAMKKYDIVEETGQDGDYYLYALANAKEK